MSTAHDPVTEALARLAGRVAIPERAPAQTELRGVA